MNLLSDSHLRSMVGLQYELNTLIDPLWLERDRPYLRGLIAQCGALLYRTSDYWGWFSPSDAVPNDRWLSYCDVGAGWSFAISHSLLSNNGDLAETCHDIQSQPAIKDQFVDAVENTIMAGLKGRCNYPDWQGVCLHLGLDGESVFVEFCIHLALNRARLKIPELVTSGEWDIRTQIARIGYSSTNRGDDFVEWILQKLEPVVASRSGHPIVLSFTT